MKCKILIIASLSVGLLWAATLSAETGTISGSAKVGFVYIDDEGDQSVTQASFNRYEGLGLSLERMRYQFQNGTRLYANLKNMTLNNRQLSLGVTRSGKFGFTFRNSQYRRFYGNEAGQFTRRRSTSGQLWIQAINHVRVFGGFGITGRKGTTVNLYEAATVNSGSPMDYKTNRFNIGVRLKDGTSYWQGEYRKNDYTDELNSLNDRESARFRVNLFDEVPMIKNLFVNGGYQNYEARLINRADTLISNTVWGGLRYNYSSNISLRYSALWDRSRRSGDLAPTDNIAHAFWVGHQWRGQGGMTIGYRLGSTDGVPEKLTHSGFLWTGWWKPIERLTFKASFGSDETEVTEGTTLTGDRDRNRYRGSLKYKLAEGHGFVRLFAQKKKTDNEDISATAEFLKAGGDGRLVWSDLGEIQLSYSYLEGDYTNRSSTILFSDHVLSGDYLTPLFSDIRLGIGGTYVRSRQDVDIERTQLRLTGSYAFLEQHLLEVKFTVDNFDNYDDPGPVYSEFYTSNMVEVSLSHQF